MYVVKLVSNSLRPDINKEITYGEYISWEEAVEAAKDIIDHSFKEQNELGVDLEVWVMRYRNHGSYPCIEPQPVGKNFSALEYVEQLYSVVCGQTLKTAAKEAKNVAYFY